MTDTVMICGVRNEDRRTHIERINDWDGNDASGEGTCIYHPFGREAEAFHVAPTPVNETEEQPTENASSTTNDA